MSKYSSVEKIIAVMSGKGGVGKSSVASLLAVELARRGKKVGLMDTDITGPSIPTMFGVVEQKPEMGNPGIIPVRSKKLGIEIISINLLLERPDQPVIWRGPLLSKAIQEFWDEVIWSESEVLILDLPPGTGDVPLTVMQSIPLQGVVIVSSPQDLALLIVKKAISMVHQLNKPILGLVENMSFLTCPNCGQQIFPFGEPRGKEISSELGIPFLGCLPVDPELSRHCDAGTIEDYKSSNSQSLVDRLAAEPEP
ncbi:MAG: hypothetical protein PWP04_1222 [Candidatus Atribacteria bacterium]|nr:hypothetical protein [Candidatus Atribacteria bacterium]